MCRSGWGRPKSGVGESCPLSTMPRRIERVRVKCRNKVSPSPFRIARACVTNGEFAAFVDERGYERRELWSAEGWQWRERAAATEPLYWRRESDAWQIRRYA